MSIHDLPRLGELVSELRRRRSGIQDVADGQAVEGLEAPQPQRSSGARVMGSSPPPCGPGKLLAGTLAWLSRLQKPPRRGNLSAPIRLRRATALEAPAAGRT